MQDLIQPYFFAQETDTSTMHIVKTGIRGKLAKALRLVARKID
jgi:hypothetical protein